jgi:hypothetical protein
MIPRSRSLRPQPARLRRSNRPESHPPRSRSPLQLQKSQRGHLPSALPSAQSPRPRPSPRAASRLPLLRPVARRLQRHRRPPPAGLLQPPIRPPRAPRRRACRHPARRRRSHLQHRSRLRRNRSRRRPRPPPQLLRRPIHARPARRPRQVAILPARAARMRSVPIAAPASSVPRASFRPPQRPPRVQRSTSAVTKPERSSLLPARWVCRKADWPRPEMPVNRHHLQ